MRSDGSSRSGLDLSGDALSRDRLGLLGHVLDCMGVGFIATDDTGAFTVWNRTATRITGVGQTEKPPEDWQEHYGVYQPDETTPLPTSDLPIVRALSGHEVHGVPLFLRNPGVPDGRHIRVTATPLRGEDEQIEGVACVFEDATEQRINEQALRRAERQVSLGTLAAGLAHEVNNPIMAAWTSAEAARNQLLSEGSRDAVLACLDNAVTAAQRASVLVRNVLAFARGRSLERRPQDLNDVVETALDMVRAHAEDNGATIELSVEDRLPTFSFDRIQLQQVVINLVRNAMEAGDNTRIRVRTSSAGGFATLAVADDGDGMSPEERNRAFDPFFTTRELGTGLGLTLVDRIVTDHGGSIQLDSAPDRGTTVSIHLPLQAPEERAEVGT